MSAGLMSCVRQNSPPLELGGGGGGGTTGEIVVRIGDDGGGGASSGAFSLPPDTPGMYFFFR